MKRGIYTLANDAVYDHVIALLNSIEVFCGKDMPVCIIPFDENISKLKKAIQERNVFFYEDIDHLNKYEKLGISIWKAKEKLTQKKSKSGYGKGIYRKIGVFDIDLFDEFVYLDADILLMDKLYWVFNKLRKYEFVVYDFSFKKPSLTFDINSKEKCNLFTQKQIKANTFNAGFFGSRKNVLNAKLIFKSFEKIKKNDCKFLNPNLGDQAILNYIVMYQRLKFLNLVNYLPKNKIAGSSAGASSHFVEKNHILYDKGVRLTYLHFTDVSPLRIKLACQGENIDFPYRDVFMYYRYLHEPEKMPKFEGEPLKDIPNDIFSRIKRKVREIVY